MTDSGFGGGTTNPLQKIYGDNPLLLPLGPRIAFQDLPARITNRPLVGQDITNLNVSDREELLVLYEQNFMSTLDSINIVAALQSLHREHYWQRHPRNPTVQRERVQIAQFSNPKNFDIQSVPWLNTSARGMIIKGITGTGKTAIANRYTSLLTHQVHEHSNGTVPGFEFVKQVCWIKVDMSNDGSRDGFLTSILLEVDKRIDTNYAKQFSSGRYSIDKLAIIVGVILSTHLCGMLIIEEIQEKNFNNSKWRSQLTAFFLRILNFGIPTVLIGNPLGFTEMEKSSQNVRRLSSGGVFEMLPSIGGKDLDFENIVEHTLSFNVMNRDNEQARQYFRNVAYQYSGGITDFVVRLNVESQMIALRSGALQVLPEHIDAAFSGPRMVANHPLIRGLVTRNPDMLRLCNDVPVQRFLDIWLDEKKKGEKQATESEQASPPLSNKSSALENPTINEDKSIGEKTNRLDGENSGFEHPLAKRLKTQKTRIDNQQKKAADNDKHRSPDDIRGGGVKTSLVEGLKDLLNPKK